MALVYIASVTASSSTTVAFTSGIDATYNEYQFHFVNMHPQTLEVNFGFQVNAEGASGFDEAIISTFFRAYHDEADSYTDLGYNTTHDQATTDGNGTYQVLNYALDQDDNDESACGLLTLYAPSSTTYVKHFTSRTNASHHNTEYSLDAHAAGYINTTAAIDEISFKMSSGNIDSGEIHMYGVG
jgi:hypothetical protein